MSACLLLLIISGFCSFTPKSVRLKTPVLTTPKDSLSVLPFFEFRYNSAWTAIAPLTETMSNMEFNIFINFQLIMNKVFISLKYFSSPGCIICGLGHVCGYDCWKGVVAGADPGGRTRRAPPKIGKNKIFWRKSVIFHTKYPKHFRASLRSAQFV
jgi:hypothetical protein